MLRLLFALVFALLGPLSLATCNRSRPERARPTGNAVKVTFISKSGATLKVKLGLRATSAELRRPLEGLRAGTPDSGYLLAYPRDRALGVDVSSTRVSTDVVLLDAERRIVTLRARVAAGADGRVDRIPDLFRYALVLPAGTAAKARLAVGDRADFALPPEAAPERVLVPVTLQAPSRPSLEVLAEVVIDDEEITMGLMYRRDLPPLGGMLFRFPRARVLGFWMENTRVPLDMIFLDDDRQVTGVVQNAKPYDRTVVGVGNVQSRYVLEVRAGFARQYGIVAGTRATFAIPRD
jgi:uncharacterized membrane protein (UPF0127 family)